MTMSHANHHHHSLNAAFFLTAIFALVELIGGLMANSLALLADAGHMVLDVLALGLAILAKSIAMRPAHEKMTYGYGRAKILAAQLNALTLCFLSAWITWEAMERLANPPVVQGTIVLWIASIGLMINLIIMRWLHGSHDINTRAAYWHVLGDALGSIAAIIAGGVIMLTGWMLIDPILSFVVAAILAWGGWRLIRETTLELMEAVPQDIDLAIVKQAMQAMDGVVGTHHIHIWRLPDGQLSLSAHVEVETMQSWEGLLEHLNDILQNHGIDHTTLQPESSCCEKKH